MAASRLAGHGFCTSRRPSFRTEFRVFRDTDMSMMEHRIPGITVAVSVVVVEEQEAKDVELVGGVAYYYNIIMPLICMDRPVSVIHLVFVSVQ